MKKSSTLVKQSFVRLSASKTKRLKSLISELVHSNPPMSSSLSSKATTPKKSVRFPTYCEKGFLFPKSLRSRFLFFCQCQVNSDRF